LARTDFRAAAARRLSEEREHSPAIVSLLSNDRQGRPRGGVRNVDVDRITPNPEQPRLSFDETSLEELAASIREHGVLQPILVRPSGPKFELIAGERRWRASGMANRETIPAIVVEFDESTALEVSIIENLQREDVSPLEEAAMFRKMTETFGYSVRQLAQKVGKDKGYVENRLRLTDAPADIRELVSLRKDTISHAYELMKIGDERKRRRLAKRIAAGDLSLAKLRLITGATNGGEGEPEAERTPRRRAKTAAGHVVAAREADDALMGARSKLAEGVDDMVEILRQPELMEQIPSVNRDNFVKHLTITKLKIENAIAIIRAGAPARDEALE